MIVFFDASAAVKWFVEEDGTDAVERLRGDATGAVSRLTEVELISALARRHREGSIPADVLERLVATSLEELGSLVVVEIGEIVVGRARALLLRHPLRAGEAIQLGSCLELQDRLREPVRFAAFDQRLNDAAVREGLGLALSPELEKRP